MGHSLFKRRICKSNTICPKDAYKKMARDVEVDILYFLVPFLEKSTKFIVGGNSVAFDKHFIEVHF